VSEPTVNSIQENTLPWYKESTKKVHQVIVALATDTHFAELQKMMWIYH
jgi:hypothetical protein